MSTSIENAGKNDVLKGCIIATDEDKGVKYTFYIKDRKVVAECRKSEENGKDIERWYNVDSQLHRDGDLPAVAEYDKKGQKTSEHWYRVGKKHRDGDLPAVIWYKNGQKTSEYWYRDGKYHRDGGLPAMILYENGQKTSEHWHRDGKLHRDGDLPAVIWYKNGQKTSEEWYRDGAPYAPEKPNPIKDYLAEIEACYVKINKQHAKIAACLAKIREETAKK